MSKNDQLKVNDRAVRAEIIAFTAFDSAELRTGPTVTGPRAKVQNIQLNAHKTP